MGDVGSLLPRWVEGRIEAALADTPVTLIAGPRQAGKTTLARRLAAKHGLRYLTLDDEGTLLSAREDPAGLVRALDRAVFDEVQRAPGLLRAVKKSVDEDRRFGRFLLTGSADLMTLPTVAESLAGRMESVTLLPFAQGELRRTQGRWLAEVFEGRVPQPASPLVGEDLVHAVLAGGYPEVVARPTLPRRRSWVRQYLDALIRRDVKDLAEVEKTDHLARLLRVLAEGAGQICNYSELGARVGLDHKTAARYLGIFEQMYLLRRIEPWGPNRLKRLVRRPKIQFLDSGLLSVLQGLEAPVPDEDRVRWGHVLESFVVGELLKLAAAGPLEPALLYFRDQDQNEVDVVLEDGRGRLVGVEVKASATVKAGDFRGLRRLSVVAGRSLVAGLLLYDGTEVLPMGERLWAAPLSSLWGV